MDYSLNTSYGTPLKQFSDKIILPKKNDVFCTDTLKLALKKEKLLKLEGGLLSRFFFHLGHIFYLIKAVVASKAYQNQLKREKISVATKFEKIEKLAEKIFSDMNAFYANSNREVESYVELMRDLNELTSLKTRLQRHLTLKDKNYLVVSPYLKKSVRCSLDKVQILQGALTDSIGKISAVLVPHIFAFQSTLNQNENLQDIPKKVLENDEEDTSVSMQDFSCQTDPTPVKTKSPEKIATNNPIPLTAPPAPPLHPIGARGTASFSGENKKTERSSPLPESAEAPAKTEGQKKERILVKPDEYNLPIKYTSLSSAKADSHIDTMRRQGILNELCVLADISSAGIVQKIAQCAYEHSLNTLIDEYLAGFADIEKMRQVLQTKERSSAIAAPPANLPVPPISGPPVPPPLPGTPGTPTPPPLPPLPPSTPGTPTTPFLRGGMGLLRTIQGNKDQIRLTKAKPVGELPLNENVIAGQKEVVAYIKMIESQNRKYEEILKILFDEEAGKVHVDVKDLKEMGNRFVAKATAVIEEYKTLNPIKATTRSQSRSSSSSEDNGDENKPASAYQKEFNKVKQIVGDYNKAKLALNMSISEKNELVKQLNQYTEHTQLDFSSVDLQDLTKIKSKCDELNFGIKAAESRLSAHKINCVDKLEALKKVFNSKKIDGAERSLAEINRCSGTSMIEKEDSFVAFANIYLAKLKDNPNLLESTPTVHVRKRAATLDDSINNFSQYGKGNLTSNNTDQAVADDEWA